MTEGKIASDTDAGTRLSATLQFDPARYRTEVDRFDLTEEQKLELLATLWSIMRSFVELGFTADVGAALMDGFAPMPDCGDGETAIRSVFNMGGR